MFLSDPTTIIGYACHSLTHCRLVNLIDVTLACDDGNSKLVEVVTVVEVDDEKRVDHWECLSVTDSLTHSLTHSCLVNLIDVTLVCEDDNSKLVEVVTVAQVDDEICVDNSFVQIWKVNFGHKVKFLFGL